MQSGRNVRSSEKCILAKSSVEVWNDCTPGLLQLGATKRRKIMQLQAAELLNTLQFVLLVFIYCCIGRFDR